MSNALVQQLQKLHLIRQLRQKGCLGLQLQQKTVIRLQPDTPILDKQDATQEMEAIRSPRQQE
tara:strand:- start:2124 stop:2312 length:189 start_codon:yes stop_codon:yes gene_type:complete